MYTYKGKVFIFHLFASEKVEQQALAFCVFFILMPQITSEDETRFYTSHHLAGFEILKGFEVF